MSSFAWTSVVLVVYFLPGFSFFYGYSTPSHKVRGPISMSTFESIVLVLFAALLAHLIAAQLIFWTARLCPWWETTPSLTTALELLGAEFPGASSDKLIRENIQNFLVHIIGYFLLICLATYWLGRILSFHYRRNADHSWALELAAKYSFQDRDAGSFTLAFVMSHVSAGHKVLMYRGILEYLRLSPNGTIAYLLLDEVSRFYMHLEDDHPTTTDPDSYQSIGGSSDKNLSMNKLLIEGEDIANVVFQEVDFPLLDDRQRVIIEVISRIPEEKFQDMSDHQIRELLRNQGISESEINDLFGDIDA